MELEPWVQVGMRPGARENQFPAFTLLAVPNFRRPYPSENTSPNSSRVINPMPPPPLLDVELGGGDGDGGGEELLPGTVTVTGLD